MFTLEEICDLGIQIEKNGEAFYRDALKRPWSKPMSSMIQMLAEEEVKHVDFFTTLKRKLKEKAENPVAEAMGREMLAEVLGDQTFSLKDVDFSKIETLDQLRRTAIEFEKDTILFYEMVRAFLRDHETIDHLEKIIDEENRHVRLFEEYGNLEKPFSLYPKK